MKRCLLSARVLNFVGVTLTEAAVNCDGSTEPIAVLKKEDATLPDTSRGREDGIGTSDDAVLMEVSGTDRETKGGE